MSTRHAHALGWHWDDLRDFEIRLVIHGPPFSFKRAKQIVQIPNGRPTLALTKEAKAYMRAASVQLRSQWLPVFRSAIPGNVGLNAAIVSYLPTRRRTDASNLYEAPQDALKACGPNCKPKCDRHAGVIDDDSQIVSHDGSRRRYDRDNPRVEITLTPSRDVDQLPLPVEQLGALARSRVLTSPAGSRLNPRRYQ